MIKTESWTLKWEFTLAFLWEPFIFCILIGALNTWKHWRNWSEYHLRLIKQKWAQNNGTYLFLRIVKRWIPFPSTPPSVFCLRASLLFSPKDCRLLWKPTQFLVWNYHKSRDLSTFKVDFVDPEGDLVRRLQVSLDIHPVVLQRGLAHLRNSWELKGGFVYCSALKKTKCQTPRNFWHLKLFWWDLDILPWKRFQLTLHK